MMRPRFAGSRTNRASWASPTTSKNNPTHQQATPAASTHPTGPASKRVRNPDRRGNHEHPEPLEHVYLQIRELGAARGAPRMMITTPSGERHALGSMIAGAAAVHDEWHVTWLGVDLPADQIAAAADRDGAHVVSLGVVSTDGREAPRAEVEQLRRLLPVRVPLLIGGSGASAFSDLPGITVIRDVQHWRGQIRRHSPTISS